MITHPEIAFRKVASTDALVKLIQGVPPELFVSRLCSRIRALGLTHHQDEFIRAVANRAAEEHGNEG